MYHKESAEGKTLSSDVRTWRHNIINHWNEKITPTFSTYNFVDYKVILNIGYQICVGFDIDILNLEVKLISLVFFNAWCSPFGKLSKRKNSKSQRGSLSSPW